METRLARWGNGMAMRIPKSVAEAAKLRAGDHLELVVEGSGRVSMRKKKGKQSLRDLVRGITPENLHADTDWGAPEGGELW